MHLHPVFLIGSAPRRAWFSHASTGAPTVNAQQVSLPTLMETPYWMYLLVVLLCPGSRRAKAVSLSYHQTTNAFFGRVFLSTASYYPFCNCNLRLQFSRGWVRHSCIQNPEAIPLSFCKQTASLWQGTCFCSHMVNWIAKRIQLKANPAKIWLPFSWMLSSIAAQLQEKLCQENAKEQLAVAVGAGGSLLSAVPGRSAR